MSSPSSSMQPEKPYKPKFHNASLYAKDEQPPKLHTDSSSQIPIVSSEHTSSTPLAMSPSCSTPISTSISYPLVSDITFVWFLRTTNLYNKIPMLQSTQNVEYLKEHISKIISQNEAIVDVVDPALQKKYHKITGITRGFVVSENSSSKLAIALLKQREETLNNLNNNNTNNSQGASTSTSGHTTANIYNGPSTSGTQQQNQQQQHLRRALPTLQQQAQLVVQQSSQAALAQQSAIGQPLNLTKSHPDNDRKRCVSDSFAAGLEVATHPQNPERSIIKDLLLNSRGLAVPSNGEGEDAVYTCPLCKINFRSADNLKYHTQHYCQGMPSASPQSAPISPVGSPSHKYFRSNSFNANLPEKYNPNTLAKLAHSTLKHPNRTPLSLAKLAQTQIRPGRSKPENIVINTETCPAPTPLAIVTNPLAPPIPASVSSCAPQITKLIEIDAPLPSPGPLLGKTRLVDTYNPDRKTEEAIISHFPCGNAESSFTKRMDSMDAPKSPYNVASTSKRARYDTFTVTPPPMVFNSALESPSPNTRLLQMCGGDIRIVERREETVTPRFGSSGGSIVSISPSPDSLEHNSIVMRSGLHSGGSVVDSNLPSKEGRTTPMLTPKFQITPNMGHPMQIFQFPPINSITGYNPLTLPPASVTPGHASQILHGGKLIPFVPGMPGPNSLAPPRNDAPMMIKRGNSPNRRMIPSPLTLSPMITPPPPQSQTTFTLPSNANGPKQSPRSIPSIKVADVDELKWRKGAYQKNGYVAISAFQVHPQQQLLISSTLVAPPKVSPKPETKKKFNFSRIADNLSPRKVESQTPSNNGSECRHFNFEKPELLMRLQDIKSPLQIDVSFTTSDNSWSTPETLSAIETPPLPPPALKPSKFLRPSSLPLKPGTFTPKRHHGITPTANTLPLISPETPRPSKNCVQLYLNGHAYTYLGLKCSTKTFYCTVNRPQPVHFTNQHKLSIYSNWQICAESNPHPMGLTPKIAMSLYDSRQRPTQATVAKLGPICATLHSQSLIVTPVDQPKSRADFNHSQHLYSLNSGHVAAAAGTLDDQMMTVPAVPGGYESNADYTYVRGRGRGRYVCSECGIRCKKPSMLKKHIRTHTDVRPYTCQHCSFR